METPLVSPVPAPSPARDAVLLPAVAAAMESARPGLSFVVEPAVLPELEGGTEGVAQHRLLRRIHPASLGAGTVEAAAAGLGGSGGGRGGLPAEEPMTKDGESFWEARQSWAAEE